MSNSHWYHFFFFAWRFWGHKIKDQLFTGGKVCLVVTSGGGGGMCPFCTPTPPPLGSGTAMLSVCLFFVIIFFYLFYFLYFLCADFVVKFPKIMKY